ncbi:MAG: MCP four helix bundle domain-containing protein [Lachnospiraceae bacterium]|nr:MCP four helix bundle domain-containing protein [Lachnospiraceae bacterium]
MFANLKNMRIQKRLKTSYNIVIALAGVASLVGIVVMFIMTSRYDHTLTNYAFPQGDIGLAMTELAEIRSATRAVIGYEQQSAMDKEMAKHDQSVEELDKLLAAIEVTMVTPEGRQSFASSRERNSDFI